jgi:hypothetical protein
MHMKARCIGSDAAAENPVLVRARTGGSRNGTNGKTYRGEQYVREAETFSPYWSAPERLMPSRDMVS